MRWTWNFLINNVHSHFPSLTENPLPESFSRKLLVMVDALTKHGKLNAENLLLSSTTVIANRLNSLRNLNAPGYAEWVHGAYEHPLCACAVTKSRIHLFSHFSREMTIVTAALQAIDLLGNVNSNSSNTLERVAQLLNEMDLAYAAEPKNPLIRG